jgi:hypothetical protein
MNNLLLDHFCRYVRFDTQAEVRELLTLSGCAARAILLDWS